MEKRIYLVNGASPWLNKIIKEYYKGDGNGNEDSIYVCKYTCPQCRLFLEEYEEGIFRCLICGQVAIEDREEEIFYMRKV